MISVAFKVKHAKEVRESLWSGERTVGRLSGEKGLCRGRHVLYSDYRLSQSRSPIALPRHSALTF